MLKSRIVCTRQPVYEATSISGLLGQVKCNTLGGRKIEGKTFESAWKDPLTFKASYKITVVTHYLSTVRFYYSGYLLPRSLT